MKASSYTVYSYIKVWFILKKDSVSKTLQAVKVYTYVMHNIYFIYGREREGGKEREREGVRERRKEREREGERERGYYVMHNIYFIYLSWEW